MLRFNNSERTIFCADSALLLALFVACSTNWAYGINSTSIDASPENLGISGIFIFLDRLIVLPVLSESLYSLFGEMVIFAPETGISEIRSDQPPMAVVPPEFWTCQLTVSESPGLTLTFSA